MVFKVIGKVEGGNQMIITFSRLAFVTYFGTRNSNL